MTLAKMLTGEHKGKKRFDNVKIVHTFFEIGSHCFGSI